MPGGFLHALVSFKLQAKGKEVLEAFLELPRALSDLEMPGKFNEIVMLAAWTEISSQSTIVLRTLGLRELGDILALRFFSRESIPLHQCKLLASVILVLGARASASCSPPVLAKPVCVTRNSWAILSVFPQSLSVATQQPSCSQSQTLHLGEVFIGWLAHKTRAL